MDRYWCREGGGPEIVEHWGAHGVARAAGKTGLIAGVGVVVGIGIVAAEYLHELEARPSPWSFSEQAVVEDLTADIARSTAALLDSDEA